MEFGERIINKIKSEAVDLISSFGMLHNLTNQKRGGRILMYHGVLPSDAKKFNTRHLDLDCFEKQIAFLKRHCNVLTLEDFFQKKFSKDRFNICITFDDGYWNNYKYAYPIFKKYEVPAVFFITGLNQTECNILWADFLNIASTLTNDNVEIEGKEFSKKADGFYYYQSESLVDVIKKSGFDFKLKMIEAFEKKIHFRDKPEWEGYWKLMTDNQIKEVADSGIITIGSHAFYHNNLGEIPLKEAVQELSDSKSYLESLTQKKIQSVAYPDGSYSLDVLRKAESLGFECQLADSYLFEEDKENDAIMDRHGVYPCSSCNNQIVDFFN